MGATNGVGHPFLAGLDFLAQEQSREARVDQQARNQPRIEDPGAITHACTRRSL